MKLFTLVGAVILSAALAIQPAVAQKKKKEPELSGLELQQIQAKDFEAPLDVVFSSVMSVLQDTGYIINAADKSTGLITGQGQAKTENSGLAAAILWGSIGSKTSSTRVSATVETTSTAITRVRLNFVSTTSSRSTYNLGSTDDKMITDAEIYANAFEKIEQAIFVRLALRAPAAPSVPAPANTPVEALAVPSRK
jgi:hypothetical protein